MKMLAGAPLAAKNVQRIAVPRHQQLRRRDRRSVAVVNAAPPTSNERGTVPLSKEQLVNYISSGCKPKSKWRIGTEHEKLGFLLENNERMNYEHVQHVLQTLERRFGWQGFSEDGKIIGVTLDGQNVTLEPGGQFELSGAPVSTLHQTCAEVNSHLYQVKTIAEEIGVGFLGVGFDPKWKVEEVPMMPKDRYRLMKAYMPTVGTKGLDMMFRTCTIQVNLDFESERDMVEKFRIGIALQPLALALFANSPFKEGKPTGMVSTRGEVWTDVDEARCGNLPFVFDDNFGFEQYVDWAMNVPMYFVYRDGKYINALGQSWNDFMQAKLPALPGEYPTMSDWANHLTTVFPEVRLKKFLEMRGADGGSWGMICSLPAFWVGLLYDDQAQAEALALISDWTQEERDYLRAMAPIKGLATEFRGSTMLEMAKTVLQISRGGLKRRNQEEEVFLDRLDAIVASGKTQADQALELYNTEWSGSVDPMFKQWMY